MPANHTKKQRAQSLFQQSKLKQARTLYEKICKASPRDAESHYMLGAIHGQQGNFEQAAKFFHKTLELQPNTLVALCGLGAALKALGRYKEAEQTYRKALQQKQNFPEAQLELAEVLLNQEKLTEAEEILCEILRKHPRSAEALHGLGEIRHIHNDLEQAKQYYENALQIDPNRAETHNRLGFVLHTLGRLNKAIGHFQKAIALKPDFAVAYKNMGSSLLTAGQIDEAGQAFEKALRVDPNYLDATAGQIAVLERQSQHKAAYDRLQPLLQKGLKHVGLGITFANICNKVDQCDQAIEYLQKILSVPKITDTTRIQMHYALGKLHDKLGQYGSAFQHFEQANQLQSASFSAIEHHAIIDAIIHTFNRGFLSTAPRSSMSSSRPVFIVGIPRSGTSLTEQILARHGKVFGAGELPDIGDHATRLATQLDPKQGFPYSLKKLTQDVLDKVANLYLDHLAELSPDARFVTDKMPQNFIYLGLIALLFPQAHIIHCMRDPRDTSLSIYFQYFNESHGYATNLEHIGNYYQAYRKLMTHWKNVLPIPILDVQYEDLVTQQEETTRQLLDFLGLEWDPQCLSFHEADRFVPTSSYDQVRQPIYQSSMGRWRHYEQYIGPLLTSLDI